MRRSADFESDRGHIIIRPHVIKENEELAYITLSTTTTHVNLNATDLEEVIGMLEEVKRTYIDREALL